MKKAMSYFKKHIAYTSLIHLIGGIGIGILITYPFAGIHPVRWGVALLAISLLGHLYGWFVSR
jgi:hypothetical protein